MCHYYNVKIGLHYLGKYRSVAKNKKRYITFNTAVVNFVTKGCVYCSSFQSYKWGVKSHYKYNVNQCRIIKDSQNIWCNFQIVYFKWHTSKTCELHVWLKKKVKSFFFTKTSSWKHVFC